MNTQHWIVRLGITIGTPQVCAPVHHENGVGSPTKFELAIIYGQT
jgi:hypothetical protein